MVIHFYIHCIHTYLIIMRISTLRLLLLNSQSYLAYSLYRGMCSENLIIYRNIDKSRSAWLLDFLLVWDRLKVLAESVILLSLSVLCRSVVD